MLLMESQGKSILRKHGIAVPDGFPVSNSDELDVALSSLHYPVVLKAQVAMGSRGKNGGILFAESRDQAHAALRSLIGRRIEDHVIVHVLVERQVSIAAERYVAAMVHEGDIHVMACAHGGMDIETTATLYPRRIALVRASKGTADRAELSAALGQVGFPSALIEEYAEICDKLCILLRTHDATLAEINPLVETGDQELVAVDARIHVDDAALPRQHEILSELETTSPPTERKDGLPIVRSVALGGPVGLIGLGGGLNLSIVDWLAASGRPVAALTDIDDAIAADRVAEFVRKCLLEMRDDHGVSVVLINAISCGYPLDEVARGINQALDGLNPGPSLPVVINLQGRRGAEANRVLAEAGRRNSSNLAEAIETVLTTTGTETRCR